MKYYDFKELKKIIDNFDEVEFTGYEYRNLNKYKTMIKKSFNYKNDYEFNLDAFIEEVEEQLCNSSLNSYTVSIEQKAKGKVINFDVIEKYRINKDKSITVIIYF